MPAKEGKYLTFELYGQLYAMSIDYVKEIFNECGSISAVPEFPDYSKGIINIRGDIVPVIDLRKRLHMPEKTTTGKRECLIVTENEELENKYLGFMVDMVRAVEDFEAEKLLPAPKLAASTSKYVIGIYNGAEHIVMILDPALLLTEDMKNAIEKAIN